MQTAEREATRTNEDSIPMLGISNFLAIFRAAKTQFWGSQDYPTLIPFKQSGAKAGLILLHGFHGDTAATWARFPELLASDAALREWDIHAVGYKSGLAFDVRGIWSADSDLSKLALMLETFSETYFKQYGALAVCAHSMGGLVVQRALLDNENLRHRISHLFLFGTPSAGLDKAAIGRRWKSQIQDMARGGSFIDKLRQDWTHTFPDGPSFVLRVVAGTEDEFVPASSSLGPFPLEVRRAVPGNHIEICKPQDAAHTGFRLVADTLCDRAAGSGPLNSARLAVESRDFANAIRLLEPKKEGLDEGGLVQLALAYEGMGRAEDAILLLQSTGKDKTDAMGTLAGRHKRRWIVERQEQDAVRAAELYTEALKLSTAIENWEQSHYHSANVAFMKLAFGKNRTQAEQQSAATLEYSSKARDKWAIASAAEAHLLIGNTTEAERLYIEVVRNPTFRPRDLASMLKQGTWIAEAKDDWQAAEMLARVFQMNEIALNPTEK